MIPPHDQPPNETKLRVGSFAFHAARGLVREQRTRRWAMFVVVLVAVLLLFLGSTLLAPVLDPHVRPVWFIFYWGVCAWLTVTAVLLALFDLLMVRAQGRTERRGLAERLDELDEPRDD